MAQKKKNSTSEQATVTRIKAADDAPAKTDKKVSKVVASDDTSVAKTKKPRKKPSAKGVTRPFVAFGRYFAGAWYELKQVRWPTRRATWGLTFAVLVYSAFFVVLVLLLDVGFKYLFDVILGK